MDRFSKNKRKASCPMPSKPGKRLYPSQTSADGPLFQKQAQGILFDAERTWKTFAS